MGKTILVLIAFAIAFSAFANREEQILQQSDDTREDYYDTNGLGVAQWFEAPADCHILGASFYYRYEGPKDVGVWANDDSGPYETPGEQLALVAYDFLDGTSWTWSDYVDLTGAELTMSSGEKFWVGLDVWIYSVLIGLDEGYPSYGCAVTADGSNWIFISDADLMVRIKIDDDMDPPYVDEQDPADGEIGVDPTADIVFHCKDDDNGVNSGTINFGADDGTKADIPGTLDVDDNDPNDVICTFMPESDLPAGATITCTVGGALADGLGNEMGNDEIWTFTVTGSNVKDMSLGEIKVTYR